MGQAYQRLFRLKAIEYINLTRRDLDYSDCDLLSNSLKEYQPSFLVNCAGYTGKPNVDACELDKTNCLFGNAVLPGRIAEACKAVGIPWGHVSSGCIYTGSHSDGSGFTEEDVPNFTFRQNNCSFYSGTKALGEEVLQGYDNVYIWRLRIPFNNIDGPRNYLSKLIRYDQLLEATNSISHLDEFVAATISCWEKQVSFGTYNVTNPGQITTHQVVALIQKYGLTDKSFKFFADERDFMKQAAIAPRSNCVMDSSKLAAVGVEMTPVVECIENCVKDWRSFSHSA